MLNTNILALASKICINAGIKLFIIFNIFAKVKFFTIIFSMYILVLSCTPCGDAGENIVKADQKVSNTTSHEHTADLCTPFCSCACCPASAFYHPLAIFTIPKAVFQATKFTIVNTSCLSNNFHSIWQPPKVG